MATATQQQREMRDALIVAYLYDGLTGPEIVRALRQEDGIEVAISTVYKSIHKEGEDVGLQLHRNRRARATQKRRRARKDPKSHWITEEALEKCTRQGMTQTDIAKSFGCHVKNVCDRMADMPQGIQRLSRRNKSVRLKEQAAKRRGSCAAPVSGSWLSRAL